MYSSDDQICRLAISNMAEIHGFWLTSLGAYILVLHPESVELILVTKVPRWAGERGSRDLLDLVARNRYFKS